MGLTLYALLLFFTACLGMAYSALSVGAQVGLIVVHLPAPKLTLLRSPGKHRPSTHSSRNDTSPCTVALFLRRQYDSLSPLTNSHY